MSAFPAPPPDARLAARPDVPAPAAGSAPVAGLHRLGLAPGSRDGLRYAPLAALEGEPVPLAVVFHGAGAGAQQGVELLRRQADEQGLLVLAPDSRGRSWDLLLDGLGADVTYLDRALHDTFARYRVDPARVAVGGFSDGASYALSLGLANGDLFDAILAYSPGFMAPPERRGHPRVFVSHGIDDGVLPIDRCSRRLVPALRRAGYDVRYDEFDGRHTVPRATVETSVRWWLGGRAAR